MASQEFGWIKEASVWESKNADVNRKFNVNLKLVILNSNLVWIMGLEI